MEAGSCAEAGVGTPTPIDPAASAPMKLNAPKIFRVLIGMLLCLMLVRFHADPSIYPTFGKQRQAR
jgi:hypothetical protein